MSPTESDHLRPASGSGSDIDVATLRRRIRVALGQEPGDLVVHGGRVANVFTERIEAANVVIADGWIAGVGPFDWPARESISLSPDELVLPGLIDAHMHVESTLLLPEQLARLIVPRGTTTVIADPHEIANVTGKAGVQMLIDVSAELPFDLFFMAPSCVPASPWESPGTTLGPRDVAELLCHPRVLGLAEMMNFPGVLSAEDEVLEKIAAAHRRGQPVDGHAPGVAGQALIAYAAAGIRSDHESTTLEEGLAKAALGMLVQVREGSSARNLDAFLPALVEDRLGDWCLATDDVHVPDLMDHGHIDALVRRVVAAGVSLARAVRHASLVPARHYGLRERGAVAPSYRADLFTVSDERSFEPGTVIKDGVVVAREGHYEARTAPSSIPAANSVRLAPLSERAFELSLSDPNAPVITVIPDEILTRSDRRKVGVDGTSGRWVFDPQHEVSLIACLERHKATGRVGLGLVRGFGFRRHGALGSSVAHDAHNLVITGTNARDMLACARALEEVRGGFVVVADGSVVAALPLPVAGLMSTEDAPTVRHRLKEVNRAAGSLGCALSSPFGTLSFLCLSVIPELRIIDRGLFDVGAQRIIDL